MILFREIIPPPEESNFLTEQVGWRKRDNSIVKEEFYKNCDLKQEKMLI